MCGIAGRFHPERLPAAPEWPARAAALLAHRGPDGSGHWRDDRCDLVHRRLALMPNEDGTVYVVFNGEIYNYRALTAELQGRGHRFQGTSDTEVLVHLYEECGERMLTRLRGIFAFALYDQRRGRLFLARDRFGVKPLFYAVHDGQWVFASEMKAILALPGFEPMVDRQACYDFLGLGYIPEPATGFANIQALPRASCLTVDAQGHHLRAYERIEAHPDSRRRLADTVDTTSGLLLAAVEAQSVADVPVAALLSGGIDSSLIVAAHHRATGQETTTFNVRFPDRVHDETATALAVSAHCGTRHHTIDLADWALTPESILDLLRHFDQPFADTSFIPTHWISRAVRERGIICTLSGDGGDEAFGGYPRFWRANRLVQAMWLPEWVAATAQATGNSLAAWTRDWGRQVTKAVQLARAGRRDSAVLLAGLSNYLSEEQKRALVQPAARDELSIEVRVPLLDEDLVALGLVLPHRLKTDGRRGKIVLRELAARWLPPDVAAHPKHGFTIPLDVMVPPDFHVVLDDLLLARDARTRYMFDGRLVGTWLQLFRQARQAGGGTGGTISRAGLYQRVFMLLALELWLREQGLSW